MQLMPCDLCVVTHPNGFIESLYATTYTSPRFIDVIWVMCGDLASCGDLIERGDRTRSGWLNLIEEIT